jgi:probable phosphoglycerate mutase
MATRIFFVRHGAHDRLDRFLCGRMPGVTLSETGHAQARSLARRLARESVVAIHTSPLERARQTAAPIGEALGLEPVVDEAINEVDFGDWTGAAFADLRGRPEWRERGARGAPGGETMAQVQARIAAWVDTQRAEHPNAAVVAVCHGDVVKAGVCLALDLPLDHHHRLDVAPGSLTEIWAAERGCRLHTLNEIPGS